MLKKKNQVHIKHTEEDGHKPAGQGEEEQKDGNRRNKTKAEDVE
jgi:hypothetical protein